MQPISVLSVAAHQPPTPAPRDHVSVVLVLVQLSFVLDYRLLFLLTLFGNLSAEVTVLVCVGPVAPSAHACEVCTHRVGSHATRKSRRFPERNH